MSGKSRSHYPIKAKLLSLLTVSSLVLTMFSGITPVNAREIQTTFYVDPVDGNDETNTGTIDSPFKTIEKAKASVRSVNADMTGDIFIYLRGGDYVLSEAIAFTEADSGTNGNDVIYQAYPGETPVISGGTSITGWTLSDPGKGIYSAAVSPELETRQLYIDGVRAVRARNDEITGTWTGSGSSYTTTDTRLASWENIGDVELVYFEQFINHRYGIASITVSGETATVAMKRSAPDASTLWYIENAYELLDEPGEWYLNRTTDTIYYMPRDNENMDTVTATIPVAERLLTLYGSSLDAPVHNIRFEGISFEYTTWLAPSVNGGHFATQSNILNTPGEEFVTPAVDMKTAKSVVFERCSFSKLGGAAINMTYGSQDNLIQGCSFVDISASGVQVGRPVENGSADYNPIDIRALLKNNDIVNSYFNSLGMEYRQAVAIYGAYPSDMDIRNNEICNLPYSGITLGWGWGETDTYNRKNRLQDNYIHNVMNVHSDGGAIYLLGTAHDITVSGNYIKDQKDNYGGVYLDNGSSHITVQNNVLENVPQVFFVNTNTRYNTVISNYSNQFRCVDIGRENTIEVPDYIPDGEDWPQEAQDIIARAGIEPAYVDIIPDPAPNLVPNDPLPDPVVRPENGPVDFEGKTSLITGLGDGAKLRNNYPGYVGMTITVGSTDMTVTAIGRIRVPGNYGIHEMKILRASDLYEIANETIDMASAQDNENGVFKYVQLSDPVTLEAGVSYHVVSWEPAGDDYWYDAFSVSTTTAIAAHSAIFSAGDGYLGGGGAGTSFVGIDLLYDTGGTELPQPVNSLPQPPPVWPPALPAPAAITLPVDTENSQGFAGVVTAGTPRNDWSGWAGMKITVGSQDIAVTALGRIFIEGNSGLHGIKIVDAATSLEVSATIVDMSDGSGGAFKYAQLPSPVRLKAGKAYYILSEEKYGEDQWYDSDTEIQTGPVATVDAAAYRTTVLLSAGFPYRTVDGTAQRSFAGLDFRYTTDLSGTEGLVHNGDFEVGTGGWTTYNSVLSSITDDTLGRSGGLARVDVLSSHGHVSQGVSLVRGKTYEISVWARMESGSNEVMFVSEPEYSLHTELKPIDTTWREYKETFIYREDAASEFTNVSLRVRNGDSFTYYFDDFTIREVLEPYAIAPVENQTLTALNEGYQAGEQEIRNITLTNAGENDLTNLAAVLSGGDTGAFEIAPLSGGLTQGAAAAFTIKAGDGLPAGIYTVTVKVSADNMTDMTFTVTQLIRGEGNLISNGDFETGIGGWTPYYCDLTWNNTTTYNDSAGSAKVSVLGEWGHVWHHAPLEGGREYEVSVWVKLESGTGTAMAKIFDGIGELAERTVNDTTWTQLKATYSLPETGLAKLFIHINGGGAAAVGTTFYMDDFVIIPVVEADRLLILPEN